MVCARIPLHGRTGKGRPPQFIPCPYPFNRHAVIGRGNQSMDASRFVGIDRSGTTRRIIHTGLGVRARLVHENFDLAARDVLSRHGHPAVRVHVRVRREHNALRILANLCVIAQDIDPGVPIVILHFSIELPLVPQIAASSKRSHRGSSLFSFVIASKAAPEIITLPLKS